MKKRFAYLTKSNDGILIWRHIDFATDNLRMKFEEWENTKAYSPLLQSTGRNDADNKEIFEGDILCTKPFEERKYGYGGVVRFGKCRFVCGTIVPDDGGDEIEYDCEVFCHHIEDNSAFNESYCDAWHKCYVIGNIYSDTELLKQLNNG